MTLKALFLNCIDCVDDNAALDTMLQKASVAHYPEHNGYGVKRQSYWSEVLRARPEANEARNNALLAYVAIYYRNQADRTLPKWLEQWREQAFSNGKLTTEVCTLQALQARHWEIRDVVLASMLISSQNIAGYEFSEQEIPHWERLRRKSQYFFVGMMCGDDMVGQFALTLITQQEYRAFLASDLNESALVGQALQGPGEYWGYISTVSVISAFRSPKALRNLLARVVDLFESAREQGISFAGLAANAYTREGEKLCKLFNMQYEGLDKEHGKIYSVAGDELYNAPIFRKFGKDKRN